MKKLKTLVYVDPQSGGSLAMYDYSLLKGMENNQITFCCSTLYDAPIDTKVRYIPIFTYNRKKHILKFISYITSLIRLVAILRKSRPDTLHIQWWRVWLLDYLFLILYKKFVGQVVFTAHNLMPHNSKPSMKKKCIKYYNKIDKIIVHEKNAKIELVNSFGIKEDKIFIIPHGTLKLKVDNEHVNQLVAYIKNKYNLENKIVIGSMGTQGPYKGSDLIRDAYKQSEKLINNKNIVLLIAGRGNIFNESIDVSEYQNLIVNNKFMTEDEFEAYMQIVDVLLLPYRKISQSGVLLTAIEKEIPFAVTPIGGLIEPFSIAQVGWTIKDASIESVQLFMEYVSENISEIIKIKNDTDSWCRIKKYYDWTNISAKTENVYDFVN